MKKYLLFVACLTFTQCNKSSSDPNPVSSVTPPDNSFTSSYDILSLPFSNSFEPAIAICSVSDLALNEISGIAASAAIGNAWWVEEDSGNENKIYLLDQTGSTLATFRMTSVNDRDWEDLALSSGPLPNTPYLYLGETGDNKFQYKTKYIYRFPEPPLGSQTFPLVSEINTVDKITYQYPDAIKNAEAVMVDPETKDIYVISKEGQAVIYVARYPQDLTKTITLTKVGLLPISDVTAADISIDGKEIVIKNYALILYWKKSGSENISQLLSQTPQRAPYTPEPKGESICWAKDGSGYFTTSEITDSNPAVIYFYKRK